MEIRRYVQSGLKQMGVYHRLKNSYVYDLYWRVVDKSLLDRRKREIIFYNNVLNGLRPGDLIFDVGANVGDKTDIFLRMGARVVAIDPDEANQEVLRAKFLRKRLVPKSVVVVGKAVSDRNATETMWIDGPGSALNTLSQKWTEALKANKDNFNGGHFGLEFARSKIVETTTLEDLTLRYGMPFFVKIDVEGYEVSVIRGLKHPVPFLSFEVNLPEFRQEGLECVRLLHNLSDDGEFNYATDLQRGLRGKWLGAQDFIAIVDQCPERSIEVFWRVPATASA